MPQVAPRDRRISVPERPIQFSTKQIRIADAEVDSLIRVLKARTAFSVSGEGLTVAVLDTGLRTTHTDFANRIRAVRNFTSDDQGDPENVTDGNGHGTNVAGIIVAKGIHTGIAPGAGIVPLKVLQNDGGGSFEAVQNALDWVLENRERHQISAVSMSLGDGQNYVNDSLFTMDPVHDRILRLKALDVPVVVAAGNDYFRFKAEGMGFPAILCETVSVGAVYDAAEGPFSYESGAVAFSSGPDHITPFSQRLHEATNGRTRTDIFGPGAPVTSSGISSDQGESVQHGTSQATPVITGILLLMQELYRRTANKLPPVDLLTQCLRDGAAPILDGDDEADNVPHTNRRFLRADAFLALDAIRRKLQQHLLNTHSAFV